MSHSASIDMTYYGKEWTILDILQSLLEYGWTMNDHGVIKVLPVGDKDDFSWMSLALAETDTAFNIIAQKEAAGEIVGITLLWQETQIGGDILFFPNKTVSFNLTVNRKRLAEYQDFTDVYWYLAKIIPPLYSNGIKLQFLRWEEHI